MTDQALGILTAVHRYGDPWLRTRYPVHSVSAVLHGLAATVVRNAGRKLNGLGENSLRHMKCM
jgi:hypothetical protein